MWSGSVWIDGKISTLETAQIPLTDRGFLFGHAIFETILALQGSLVMWDAHFARLRNGAQMARLVCPTEQNLRSAIHECVDYFRAKNDESSWAQLSVRIILTGGDGLGLPPRRNHKKELLPGRVIVICRSAEPLNDKVRRGGYALKTCVDARSRELINIKSCSYLWNLISLDEAILKDFDDALFVNPEGDISESTIASFVWMPRDKKELCSAPQHNNVLPGTTLLCLQNALTRRGYQVRWQALNSADLINARACALISSVRGIVPVRQIDNFKFNIPASEGIFDEWNQALSAEQIRNREFQPR